MRDPAIGILELPDNPFAQAVSDGLSGLPVERMSIGAHVHGEAPPYRIVVDRLSFCDPFLRHLLRSWSIGGCYVLNDPFFTLVHDKLSELLIYDRLGIPHPRTVLLPRHNGKEDLSAIVRDAEWEKVGDVVGFPCVVKPVDGYAWEDVVIAADGAELRSIAARLPGTRPLLVQELIRWDSYYRAFCIDRREVRIVRWEPKPLDAGIYTAASEAELAVIGPLVTEKTAALNGALGLDFNAVEWAVRPDGTPVMIDSYNDVPDVRPEKLHPACYEWVVGTLCACIRRIHETGGRNSLAPALPPASDPCAGAR
jgi:hypothetical protein